MFITLFKRLEVFSKRFYILHFNLVKNWKFNANEENVALKTTFRTPSKKTYRTHTNRGSFKNWIMFTSL